VSDIFKTQGRTDPVSSRRTKELEEYFHADLANQYHRILGLLSKARVASTCVTLTNAAFASLISSLSETSSSTQVITPASPVIYPESTTASEKVEKDEEFGIFHSKRINTREVFTDTDGELLSSIRIERTSEAIEAGEISPDVIIENEPKHAITGMTPYLARFASEAEMEETDIVLDIISASGPFELNAIRFTPMPMAGAVSLDKLNYDGVVPVTMNGRTTYTEGESFTVNRSYLGYIHFEPVSTTRFRLKLSSNMYVSSLKCITVGVSSIIGEMNVYSRYSYAGFQIVFPEGTSRIKSITTTGDKYSPSVENVTYWIYNSLTRFNNLSDDYVGAYGPTQTLDISKPASGSLYLLMRLESINNTTPCVGKITLEFE